jgi:hypothetical protein
MPIRCCSSGSHSSFLTCIPPGLDVPFSTKWGLVSRQKSGTPLDFPRKSDKLLAVVIRCAENVRLRRLQKFEESPDIAAQYLLPKKAAGFREPCSFYW